MGLFNFWGKKKKGEIEVEKTTNFDHPQDLPLPPPPENPNEIFLQAVKDFLESQGHKAERSPQYAALMVNDSFEIASAPMPGDYHPALLHMMVYAIHPTYFPDGIEESLVGIGNNPEDKAMTAAQNYTSTVLPPILAAFTDSHDPALDFEADTGNRKVLWHPKPGEMGQQGKWGDVTPVTDLYDLVKDLLPAYLADGKFHWLKLYVARQPDGELMCDCLLDNHTWVEGARPLLESTATWPANGEFLGLKQFVMFRRCDTFD